MVIRINRFKALQTVKKQTRAVNSEHSLALAVCCLDCTCIIVFISKPLDPKECVVESVYLLKLLD